MASVRRSAAFLGLFVCIGLSASAQRTALVGFQLDVDKTHVVVGEPFIATLSLVFSEQSADDLPSQPDFGGLKVRGDPQTSSNVRRIKSDVRFTRQYMWGLAAPREGKYVIGPSSLTTRGRLYQTKPVEITATAAVDSQELPEDLRGEPILFARSGDPRWTKELEGRLFLRPQLSNLTPYVSEPVIIKYQLYKNPALRLARYTEEAPRNEGALSEELFHAHKIEYERVEHNGQVFEVAPMLRIAVTPTKPGELLLDGYRMGATLLLANRSGQRRRGDPFGMMDELFNDPFFSDPFFGGRGAQVQMPSSIPPLRVRPLPEAGMPAGFSGVVGDYELRAKVDRNELSEDDLVTLSVTIEGEGAIELAGPPTLPENDFDSVGTSHDVSKGQRGDGIGGTKTFEFVLRPRRTGRLTLPAIAYPVFNHRTEQYEVLQSEPIALAISPGIGPRPPMSEDQAEMAGRELGIDDLQYVKSINQLDTRRVTSLLASPLIWLLQLAALGLLGLSWWRRRVQLARDPAQVRRQGAWRAFEKRLRELRRRAGGDEEAASRLESATRAFIADRFNLAADGLTRQEIENLLHAQAMPIERVRRLCDLLDQCATLRYAPAGPAGVNVKSWSVEISTLLREGLGR